MLIYKDPTSDKETLSSLQLQIFPFHDFMCYFDSDSVLERFVSFGREDHKR